MSCCREYVYLDVTFDDNKRIEKPIIHAKKIIGCLSGIFWNRKIAKRRKLNILETMVKSTLPYGAETWRMMEKYKVRVESVEMDATRSCLCTARRDKIRNGILKQRMKIERSVMRDKDMKQLTWYGGHM